MRIYFDSGPASRKLAKRLSSSNYEFELFHGRIDGPREIKLYSQPTYKDIRWDEAHFTWDDSQQTWDSLSYTDDERCVYEDVQNLIGSINRKDVLHVVMAIINRCSVFVTEDTDISNHKEHLKEKYGLHVINRNELTGNQEDKDNRIASEITKIVESE